MVGYLPLIGISLGAVIGMSLIVAMFRAGWVFPVGLKIWVSWVKKYWMIGIVLVSGIFTLLVTIASRKAVEDGIDDHGQLNVKADAIKERIRDVNMETNAEIKVAKERKRINDIKLREAKKIKDPVEKRKRLAELLILLLVMTTGCAPRNHVNIVSAIPKPIIVDEYIAEAQDRPQFNVEMDSSCGWDKIVIPSGVLISDSGEHIDIPGGILISDCKVEQLIEYKSSAELFYVQRNQLAIAYDALYNGCRQTEAMYQEALRDQEIDLWEEVDFEVGVAVGAMMCIGMAYGLDQAIDN